MRSIYVPIGQKTLDALVSEARRERRRPQEQAALYIERALGLLPDLPHTPDRQPEETNVVSS